MSTIKRDLQAVADRDWRGNSRPFECIVASAALKEIERLEQVLDRRTQALIELWPQAEGKVHDWYIQNAKDALK